MANIVRQEMGLDAAQAAGGWKSREVVEKTYTDVPNELNKKAVEFVEKLVVGGNEELSKASRGPEKAVKGFKLRLIKNDE